MKQNWMTSHLEEVDETYTEHMQRACGFSLWMILGGLACLVHAFFPFLFERTGSRCIENLHDRMVVNRKALGHTKTALLNRPESR